MTKDTVRLAAGVPVFIHSLFRAGSTYIFNTFRRSAAGYWCYQEPLHEISLYARDNREILLREDASKMAMLRHPRLAAPYFRELHEVAERCLGALKKSDVYDAYFALGGEQFGLEYWKSLISESRGQPVIQECRTSCRIGAIKEGLGGFHVYLWRNPWDQWWSYKVADYFDATSQLFLNAPRHPEVIARLRKEIGFCSFESEDLPAQMDRFLKNPLPPEHSYLVFYVLWLLALKEGVAHADLLLNIDRLSDDAEYREVMIGMMAAHGICGVDFSDCVSPQTVYGADDCNYFERVEDKAHGLLLLSGMTQRELNDLLCLRRENEPRIWTDGDAGPSASLLRDAERARSLVLQWGRREVELRAACARQIANLEGLVVAAEAKTGAVEQQADENLRRAEVAEAEAAALEYRVGLAQTFIEDLELRVVEAELCAARLDVRETYGTGEANNSRREPVSEAQLEELKRRVVAALMQVHELEQRAIGAESRVGELEYRVFDAEIRADGMDSRAAAAEARAAELEVRAVAAETGAVGLEHRLVLSEERANALEQRARHAELRADELERTSAAADMALKEQQGLIARLEAQGAEGLAQVGAWLAERNELHGALVAAQGSANFWHAESQHWHERLLAIHGSNSWRMTAPVRAVKRMISGDFSPLRRAARLISQPVRRVLRAPAVLVVRAALNRPGVRHRVSKSLNRYPVLRGHALLFARNAGLLPQAGPRLPDSLQPTDLSAAADGSTHSTSGRAPQLSNLSASGRQIYSELQAAIQRSNRAN